MKEYLQLIALIGVLTMGLGALWLQKWELVGTVITGIFALLNLTGKDKVNEKVNDVTESIGMLPKSE